LPGYSFLKYRRLLDHPPANDPFALRVTVTGAPNARGEFVLYWMQSSRRLRANPALNYAIHDANARQLPVVIYESIRPDYPSANDRIHTFVLQGVAANRRDAAARGIRYAFFLPRTSEVARGVVRRLAQRAAIVVTDEYPTFIIRDQTRRYVARSPVAMHLFDGNGMLPMRIFEKEQYSAKFLRDRPHRLMADWWPNVADVKPKFHFDGDLDLEEYDGVDPLGAAHSCDIDHSVVAVPKQGSRDAALATLAHFVEQGLRGYATMRNKSFAHTSGLSPYLHFGHIGIAEIARAVLESDAAAEDTDAFLEEAIIRRELSFNLCFYRDDHDSLSALPDWAKRTLDAHRGDRRKRDPDDEVWNLAHRQLLETGVMHGYLRMLWGKKLIEWSETPEKAHAAMIALHERYAIDGRDPNTHAGVLWCFGKHDRPWAPERPVFGSIRYMSSDSTAKKVRLKEIEDAISGTLFSR
jgi:deoxyribodipyrimidine photo-lyase